MQKFFKGINRIKTTFLFVLICSTQSLFFSGFAQLVDNQNKIHTIVIDAGHGGKDSGALGKKSKEKDIVLNTALLTGGYIEKYFPEINVIYTRKTDVFIPLHERAKIANEANADLFISIHANSNRNTKAYGSETFALGLHKTDENLEVAKKENSVIVFEDNYEAKYEGFDPNDVQSYIMMSLMADIYLDQSLHAADLIQTQFRERVNRKDRGVKQAGFLVLWETAMPSVLIELGFVSNPTEEAFLISEQGQDYLASAIFRAFRDYKNHIEGVSESSTTTAQTSENSEQKVESEENAASADTIVKNQAQQEKTEEKPAKATEVKQKNEANKTDNNITYKVQIIYSSKQIPLNDDSFKDFNDVEEFSIDGSYKYLVGAKKDYKEAVEYSKWVKSRHPDAFIVAVLNGKIIPLSEALQNNKQN